LQAGGYGWNSFRKECVRLLLAVSHNEFDAGAEREVLVAAD